MNAAQSHPLDVTETLAIDHPADQVWAILGDFGGMSRWHPAIEAGPADKGNELGSVRRLQLKGGGVVVEKLLERSDSNRSLKYAMLDAGPIPVRDYESVLSIVSDSHGSVVTWRGHFDSAGDQAQGGAAAGDVVAIDAITGIYRSGLEGLKDALGS